MENKSLNSIARSPTLDTVIIKTIEKYSAEFNRTELWKRLPRKVMWQTYLLVLDYLQSINKIGIANNGVIVYIWNPELSKKYRNMKGVSYDN